MARVRALSRDRRGAAMVAVLVLLALVVRVGYLALTPGYRPVGDSEAYDHIAVSLVRDGRFHRGPARMGPGVAVTGPSAIHPPGYPFFLAGVYAISGTGASQRWLAARVAGALLGAVTVVLIWLIAARIWDRRVAFWAGGLAAGYVPLVVVTGTILSEALFVPLVLGTVLAALSYRERGGTQRLLAAGVLAGFAALTRANGFLVALACVPLVAAVAPGRGVGKLLRACSVPLVACLVMAPWTVRNALELHAFIPVSDLDGGTLAGTYNNVSAADRRAPWLWRQPQEDPGNARLLRSSRDRSEPALEALLRRSALRFVEHHPTAPLRAAAANTLRLADLSGRREWRSSAAMVGITAAAADVAARCLWIVAILALFGMVSKAARSAPPALWLVAVVLFASVVLVTSDTIRYRAPLDPFLVLLAGVGAASLTAWRGRRWRELILPAPLTRLARTNPDSRHLHEG